MKKKGEIMTETVLEKMNLKIIINKNTITIKDENNKILYIRSLLSNVFFFNYFA